MEVSALDRALDDVATSIDVFAEVRVRLERRVSRARPVPMRAANELEIEDASSSTDTRRRRRRRDAARRETRA
jgi:hypothetical protein